MDYLIWSFLILVLGLLFLKAHRRSVFFSRQGIPQPPEWPLLGVMPALFFPRRHVSELIKYISNTDPRAKYVGCNVFLTPTIFVRDPELVKNVLVRDFDHFAHRKTFVDEEVDPLFGQNLNFLNGDRWREVRNALSPAFTGSKMRAMFPLMDKCAENFVEVLLNKYHGDIDVKDVVGKYTNDVIASCAFGIELDSMREPENEFYLQAKQITSFSGWTLLKLLSEIMFPWLTRKLGLRIVSKEVTDFFVGVVSSTINHRKERGIVRPDMLQLLLEAQSKEAAAAKFDLLELTAQAFLFFLAGFDASASQSCLLAHELAVNPDIQAKVQAEVDALMEAGNGRPTYEAVCNDLPYLDAVFLETMRRHPMPFLNRVCSKEYVLPAALPGGRPYVVPPGAGIMIPVAAIHSDPQLFQDPERFDPGRFAKRKATTADSQTLGFGLGPRMCIGNRFAVLEIKALMVRLLSSCTLVPCGKTCVPLEYCKNNFAPAAKGGFWLRAVPRR